MKTKSEISVWRNIIRLVLIIFLFKLLSKISFYMCGKYLFSDFWMNIVSFFVFSLPILILVVLIIPFCQNTLKVKLQIFIFVVMGIIISIASPPLDYECAVRGMASRFKMEQHKIEEIRQNTAEMVVSVQQSQRIPLADCPKIIQELKPRIVYIQKEPDTHVRLIWGSGVLGSYGVTVGVDAYQIPLDTYYASEGGIPKIVKIDDGLLKPILAFI